MTFTGGHCLGTPEQSAGPSFTDGETEPGAMPESHTAGKRPPRAGGGCAALTPRPCRKQAASPRPGLPVRWASESEHARPPRTRRLGLEAGPKARRASFWGPTQVQGDFPDPASPGAGSAQDHEAEELGAQAWSSGLSSGPESASRARWDVGTPLGISEPHFLISGRTSAAP